MRKGRIVYRVSVLSYDLGPITPFPVRNGSPLSVFLLSVCIARLHSLAGEEGAAGGPNHMTAQKVWYLNGEE